MKKRTSRTQISLVGVSEEAVKSKVSIILCRVCKRLIPIQDYTYQIGRDTDNVLLLSDSFACSLNGTIIDLLLDLGKEGLVLLSSKDYKNDCFLGMNPNPSVFYKGKLLVSGIDYDIKNNYFIFNNSVEEK